MNHSTSTPEKGNPTNTVNGKKPVAFDGSKRGDGRNLITPW